MSNVANNGDEKPSVSEDNALDPDEKQVTLVAVKADDVFRVHSEVASVTNRLLEHPEFEVEETREEDGDIVALTGRLPISAVSIKAVLHNVTTTLYVSNPRIQASRHATIFRSESAKVAAKLYIPVN